MLKTRHHVVGALLAFLAIADLSSAKFRVIREWNYVNFTWPSAEVYQKALEEQLYVPENNIIAGLKYFEGFYYITLPRMRGGAPATLARIPSGLVSNTAPLLAPFPSWELNDIDSCDALQNVQNVEIDPTKGQIWIIDGGRIETLTNLHVAKCQPKLLVYDIRKMEKVLSYTFPEHVASFNGSFLYDIVLDTSDQGYAYITDNSGKDPGIIVFSVKDHKAWKIRHAQSMRADPMAAHFQVNNIPIYAPLNLASIALGPRVREIDGQVVVLEDREVYYAPISSMHLYSINSSVLRMEEFGNQDGEYQGVVKDHGLKSSQGAGMVMDNVGVLYYSLLAVNSISRWDSSTDFQTGQKIIAKDERYLEWVNSFAFDDSGNLTILVNRLNRFISGKLNLSEANFRLIASQVGGKSYLHDEASSHDSSITTEANTTTTTTTEKEDEVPALKPGTDQDPYMAPQPEPSSEPEPIAEPEPEPKAEPEPTSEPSASKSKANSSSRSDSGSTTQPPSSAASERSAIGLLTLITAGLFFVF